MSELTINPDGVMQRLEDMQHDGDCNLLARRIIAAGTSTYKDYAPLDPEGLYNYDSSLAYGTLREVRIASQISLEVGEAEFLFELTKGVMHADGE